MADLTNLAREAVEAFNTSDWERTKALMTPDYIYNEIGTQRSIQGLEVAPDGGHLFSLEKGVHDAKNKTTVFAGVPATDGRAGQNRSYG